MPIKLIHSSINPIISKNISFFDQFSLFAENSDRMVLTSGYLSVDAIVFLQRNVEYLPNMSIGIGMHLFEGFSRSQWFALKTLSEMLFSANKGEIRLSKAFKYHGKAYTFFQDGKVKSALVGSSNLSCVSPDAEASRRVFEVDISIEDEPVLLDLVSMQEGILSPSLSVDALSHELTDFLEAEKPINNIPEVEVVPEDKLREIWNRGRGPSFNLPLKCEEKSNLNVFFGKGRENKKTGLILPRPWYEVEVIVSKSITDSTGYPRYQEFCVVTDDGYKFEVKTQGQNAKNFRSLGGLAVLGAWIKGRLESAGVLKIGEFITQDHLDSYGVDHLKLTATDDPLVWLLDFSGVE